MTATETETVTVTEETPPPSEPAAEPADKPVPEAIIPVAGQPDLEPYEESVGFVATDPVAVRVYSAVDRALQGACPLLSEGRDCLGVRSDECFGKLVDLSSAVASQRDAATAIAANANFDTACGSALRS